MKKGFYQFSNDLPQNTLKKIGPIPFSIFSFLASMTNTDGECFPGIEFIVEKTGISRGSVIKSIKVLKENGLIKVNNFQRHSNLYKLNKDKSTNVVLSTDLKVHMVYPESTNDELLKVHDVYPNNNQINNNQFNNMSKDSGEETPPPADNSESEKSEKSTKGKRKSGKDKKEPDKRVGEIRSYYIQKQKNIGEYRPDYGKLGRLAQNILKRFDESGESEVAADVIIKKLDIYFSLNGFYKKKRYPFEMFVNDFNAIGENIKSQGRPLTESEQRVVDYWKEKGFDT